MKKKILVITPTNHIKDFNKKISKLGTVIFKENISYLELSKLIPDYDIIFTNPNKSKIYFDEKILRRATKLKILCTASTGTNHIDKNALNKFGIKLISLTNNKRVINKISSTAEHALALTLAAIRKIPFSHIGATKSEWNYENYIGRQTSHLTCGIIGYGRLGKFYYRFVKNLFKKVLIYDPYINIKNTKRKTKINSLKKLFSQCDVISLHVHVNAETIDLINKSSFLYARDNLVLVNTSRGEVVNNNDLLNFLKKNKNAMYATDVLSDEIKGKDKDLILKYSKNSSQQIVITQHIGGMTTEGQQIAYHGVLEALDREINQ